MRKHFNWDRVVSGLSWILVLIMFYGVGSLIAVPPIPTSPFAQMIGVVPTQIVFILLYSILATLLGYAKLTHKHTLRKRTLMAIYLVGFFTSMLGFLIGSPTDRLIKNLCVALSAAGLWLYWKLKTEYITYEELNDYEEMG